MFIKLWVRFLLLCWVDSCHGVWRYAAPVFPFFFFFALAAFTFDTVDLHGLARQRVAHTLSISLFILSFSFHDGANPYLASLCVLLQKYTTKPFDTDTKRYDSGDRGTTFTPLLALAATGQQHPPSNTYRFAPCLRCGDILATRRRRHRDRHHRHRLRRKKRSPHQPCNWTRL